MRAPTLLPSFYIANFVVALDLQVHREGWATRSKWLSLTGFQDIVCLIDDPVLGQVFWTRVKQGVFDFLLSSMEASTASCFTPQLGGVAKNAAVGSHVSNLTASKILNEDGVLGFLVKFLSQRNGRILQMHAARTLRNLAAAEDHSIKLKILNEDGTLEGLVKCLMKVFLEVSDLRKIAAQTLGNLAAADENCIRIANDKGALKGLVECLFQNYNGEHAAWGLKELARGSPQIVVSKKWAVVGLVKALSQHDRPGLQVFALLALEHFLEQPGDDDSVKEIIKDEDETIGDLVRCLSATKKPDLQKSALRVLRSLFHDSICDFYEPAMERIMDESMSLRVIQDSVIPSVD